MKDIQIDDQILHQPVLAAAVERATTLLEEEIGPSAGLVSVNWEWPGTGRNIPSIVLKISDWTGSARLEFVPSALERMTESALRIPLVRLWGDLLQVQSHKQMETLKRAVQGLEEGGI